MPFVGAVVSVLVEEGRHRPGAGGDPVQRLDHVGLLGATGTGHELGLGARTPRCQGESGGGVETALGERGQHDVPVEHRLQPVPGLPERGSRCGGVGGPQPVQPFPAPGRATARVVTGVASGVAAGPPDRARRDERHDRVAAAGVPGTGAGPRDAEHLLLHRGGRRPGCAVGHLAVPVDVDRHPAVEPAEEAEVGVVGDVRCAAFE
jgi:hypothetical protein